MSSSCAETGDGFQTSSRGLKKKKKICSSHSNLHNEHVLSSSLEVEPPFSLVDTQVLLLRAQPVLSVQDYEDIGVCPRSKHIAGENLYLVRHDWKNKPKAQTSDTCLFSNFKILLVSVQMLQNQNVLKQWRFRDFEEVFKKLLTRSRVFLWLTFSKISHEQLLMQLVEGNQWRCIYNCLYKLTLKNIKWLYFNLLTKNLVW